MLLSTLEGRVHSLVTASENQYRPTVCSTLHLRATSSSSSAFPRAEVACKARLDDSAVWLRPLQVCELKRMLCALPANSYRARRDTARSLRMECKYSCSSATRQNASRRAVSTDSEWSKPDRSCHVLTRGSLKPKLAPLRESLPELLTADPQRATQARQDGEAWTRTHQYPLVK